VNKILELLKGKPKAKVKRTLYYHNCKVMGCIVIKDNKEACRFCNTKKWKKKTVKIKKSIFETSKDL